MITEAKFELTVRGLEMGSSPEEIEFLRTNLLRSLKLMGFCSRSDDDLSIKLIDTVEA